MKIAVLAANGRTGKAFVKAAIAAGHSIRAGSLHPGELPAHPLLTEIHCDATNQNEVKELIRGQDAVASFIGHVKGSRPNVQATAMRVLVDAMQALRLKRIVSLTGTGVRFSGDHITFIDHLLNLAVKVVDPHRVKDGHDHVKVLQRSSLSWTVIRVLKLQNLPARPFTLRAHGPTKLYASRDEVAQAALEVLEAGSFIRQAPIISKHIRYE